MNGWKDYSKFMDSMSAGYEQHVKLPAWQKYLACRRGPSEGRRADGRQQVHARILYYHRPEAQAYKHRQLRYDHFECDYNLIWHFGLPVLTGLADEPPGRQWEAWRNSALTGTLWWPTAVRRSRPRRLPLKPGSPPSRSASSRFRRPNRPLRRSPPRHLADHRGRRHPRNRPPLRD